MNSITHLAIGFAACAVMLGGYVLSTVTAGRVPAWLRAAVLAPVYIIMLWTCITVYGRAIPSMLLLSLPAGEVIASYLVDGEAIYVWVQPEGDSEPLTIVLPWSEKTAEALTTAAAEGERNGTDISIEPGQGGFDDREPKFYAAPQVALPLKE